MTGEGGPGPPQKKHGGRRPGAGSSQQVILDAARAEFSEHGFEGTTMRAIARAAGVDAALIHHFFLSKGGLFSAAVQDVFTVPDLVAVVTEGEPEGMGERLARVYVGHWEDPETQPRLVGVLRSATAFDGASGTIREFLNGTLLPIAAKAGRGRHDLRASLCGSFLLGTAALRYVSRTGPTASLPASQVARLMGPTCQTYLCDRL